MARSNSCGICCADNDIRTVSYKEGKKRHNSHRSCKWKRLVYMKFRLKHKLMIYLCPQTRVRPHFSAQALWRRPLKHCPQDPLHECSQGKLTRHFCGQSCRNFSTCVSVTAGAKNMSANKINDTLKKKSLKLVTWMIIAASLHHGVSTGT
jgi:hypothetical protein